MLDKLDQLKDYTYYFQFTLNAYGRDVETGVPSKNNVIIPAFQKLSDKIGPERVIWRYDPIFISKIYTIDYHLHYFEQLAKRLSPYTKKCTISFLDFYRNTQKNIAGLNIEPFTPEIQERIAENLAAIARSYGLKMDTCAEGIDLQKYGIDHARCIDDRLFSELLGSPLTVGKDKNQRLECNCIESLDIGAYNTCRNGCKYCYANFSSKTVCRNAGIHDPESPLLIGNVEPTDKITERIMHSCIDRQIQFNL